MSTEKKIFAQAPERWWVAGEKRVPDLNRTIRFGQASQGLYYGSAATTKSVVEQQ